MNLIIPPTVLMQAAISLAGGILAMVLGFIVMHRAWVEHDRTSERQFLTGLMLSSVGISWVVITCAIIMGSVYDGDELAETAIQQLVVFTNAATRMIIAFLAGHLVFEVWKDFRDRA